MKKKNVNKVVAKTLDQAKVLDQLCPKVVFIAYDFGLDLKRIGKELVSYERMIV